jgi:magnesium transporter
MRPYFQDVLDHVLRLYEMADINRETLASMLDVHLSAVSNDINVVLRKMTVYSLMIMVAGLFAGIYGMNFDYMPELKWRLGYPLALLVMAAAAGTVYLLFKRKRWL